jgi:CRISPR type III-associated protein (TIGR04423 family)
MEGLKKINNISEIPATSYVGYVWFSNSEKPKMLHKQDFEDRNISSNPFIVEALLFDEANNISVHILHDGSYNIIQYDLETLKSDGFQLVSKAYLPHRLEGVEKVHFVQLWKAEEDSLCEGMLVDTLKATVFCGFKKLEL